MCIYEETIMDEPASPAEPTNAHPSERFHRLPDSIRLEDTIATHPSAPPPDPTMGRDSERDFMLRNAGG
jgi:hypothetical protein